MHANAKKQQDAAKVMQGGYRGMAARREVQSHRDKIKQEMFDVEAKLLEGEQRSQEEGIAATAIQSRVRGRTARSKRQHLEQSHRKLQVQANWGPSNHLVLWLRQRW